MNHLSKVEIYTPGEKITFFAGKNVLVENPYIVEIFEHLDTKTNEYFIEIRRDNVPYAYFRNLSYMAYY